MPAEEIVDPLPPYQRSTGHYAFEGTYFDFFEVRRVGGEQGVPVWVIWFEVAKEVDRKGPELSAR